MGRDAQLVSRRRKLRERPEQGVPHGLRRSQPADTCTPDTWTPDTWTPDTQTPDTWTPDTRTPDTWTPDTWTPDTCTPDSSSGSSRETVNPRCVKLPFVLLCHGHRKQTRFNEILDLGLGTQHEGLLQNRTLKPRREDESGTLGRGWPPLRKSSWKPLLRPHCCVDRRHTVASASGLSCFLILKESKVWGRGLEVPCGPGSSGRAGLQARQEVASPIRVR